MAPRVVQATIPRHQKSHRRILGYHQLWILKAHLDEPIEEEAIAARRKAVATAAQRTISPLCQFVTRRIGPRTPEWVESIRFVLPRQRRSEAGRPSRW